MDIDKKRRESVTSLLGALAVQADGCHKDLFTRTTPMLATASGGFLVLKINL